MSKIANTVYYDNAGLATNSTLVNGVKVSNQLTDYATNLTIASQRYYDNTGLATVTSTNSIKDSVAKLMGTGTSGISLSTIANTLPTLAVNTGLNVNDLSTIKTNTATTNSNLGSVYSALGGSSTGGVGLDNLKIKNVDYINMYSGFAKGYASDTGSWITTTHPDYYYSFTSAQNLGLEGQTYTYYAKGGFTGSGNGIIDSTGQRQAGIVHENEWVAPAWMIEENEGLFGRLEMARLNKGFADGGFTSPRSFTAKEENQTSKLEEKIADSNAQLVRIQNELNKVYALLSRVTSGGTAMLTEAIK